MITLVRPVNSLHGTPSEELSDAYFAARTAVMSLIKVFEEAAPNGRDYYPAGPDALRGAAAEFNLFAQSLTTLSNELLSLADPGMDGDGKTVGEAMSALPAKRVCFPVIHTNGTSRGALKDQAKAIVAAAGQATEKLKQTIPNSRDYDSSESWVAAREQSARHLTVLSRITEYALLVIMEAK